ncbi:LmeA family phospholipid-binding protein [Microlunatus soli]|uniref:DUF2993 domain-containing protein n=1 Tax=Microlunatus soli TaxID=630515 RepID=A0A1H1NQ17_9ACTN|nr:DUF2993 domain-containing protein [Microlunatus soli]SDS00900.1 Protein of unknown function [Microlunatus soli]
MSQPWDPASEDPDGGRSDRPTERGPSFEAPTWRPVETGPRPAMPPGPAGPPGPGEAYGSGAAYDGPDWQRTADLSQPTPVDNFQPGQVFGSAGAAPVVPPPARRSRRPSGPVIVGIVVIGLLVLLLAVDRVGAAVAGQRTAAHVQQSYGLSQSPQVDFGGFPFLTQLATSTFDEVDVHAEDLPIRQQSGELTIDELEATLRDVRPESERIRIGSLQGSALVGYQGISGLLGRDVGYAGRDGAGGRLRIELTGALAVTAGLSYDAASSRFQVRDVKLTAGGQTLPGGIVEPLINQLMTPVSALPDGLQPTRVDVTAEGVRLHGTGEDLLFDR